MRVCVCAPARVHVFIQLVYAAAMWCCAETLFGRAPFASNSYDALIEKIISHDEIEVGNMLPASGYSVINCSIIYSATLNLT